MSGYDDGNNNNNNNNGNAGNIGGFDTNGMPKLKNKKVPNPLAVSVGFNSGAGWNSGVPSTHGWSQKSNLPYVLPGSRVTTPGCLHHITRIVV